MHDLLAKLNAELLGLKSDLIHRLELLENKSARPHLSGNLDRAPMDEAQELHSKAFRAFLKGGFADGLAEIQRKALSVGVAADGGYAVPEALQRAILAVETAQNPLRRICRVDPALNDTHEILVSQGVSGAAWVGETAARPETSSPTLASVIPPSGELYANPKATQRILDDAMFDVGAWLADVIGRDFAAKESAAFVSGDGTNKPKGFLSYTITASPTFGQIKQVKSGSAGAVAVDRLFDVVAALAPGYRQNAKWVMSTDTLAAIRKLKDSTNQYLWAPGMASGQPDKLLGYEVVECADMPAMAANSNSIALADWSRAYVITDIGPTRVLRDNLTAKPYTHFYTTKRVGGGLLDSNAIVVHTLGL